MIQNLPTINLTPILIMTSPIARYKSSKSTDDAARIYDISPSLRSPDYLKLESRIVYDYISNNCQESLDQLSYHCQVVIGCSKETFSRAVQIYIMSQKQIGEI